MLDKNRVGRKIILDQLIASYWVIESNYCHFLPKGTLEVSSESAVCLLYVSGLTKTWLHSRALYILSLLVGGQVSTSQEFHKENQFPKTSERVGYLTKDCMGNEREGKLWKIKEIRKTGHICSPSEVPPLHQPPAPFSTFSTMAPADLLALVCQVSALATLSSYYLSSISYRIFNLSLF